MTCHSGWMKVTIYILSWTYTHTMWLIRIWCQNRLQVGCTLLYFLAAIFLVYISVCENWIWYSPIISYFCQLLFSLSLLLGLLPFVILCKSNLSSGSCSYQEIDISYREGISPIFPKSWKSSQSTRLTTIDPIWALHLQGPEGEKDRMMWPSTTHLLC